MIILLNVFEGPVFGYFFLSSNSSEPMSCPVVWDNIHPIMLFADRAAFLAVGWGPLGDTGAGTLDMEPKLLGALCPRPHLQNRTDSQAHAYSGGRSSGLHTGAGIAQRQIVSAPFWVHSSGTLLPSGSASDPTLSEGEAARPAICPAVQDWPRGLVPAP